MNHPKKFKIGLAGNPNSGKSSLFNYLTGLNQDVSNFPGVTVDIKTGSYTNKEGVEIEIIDFPGTYSVFPNSYDEKIVINILTDLSGPFYPDLIIYVADVTQLDRHLLFATQIKDLGFPMLFIINMLDLVDETKSKLNTQPLISYLNTEVIAISIRNNMNLDSIRNFIDSFQITYTENNFPLLYHIPDTDIDMLGKIKKLTKINNNYKAKLIAHHYKWLPFLDSGQVKSLENIVSSVGFNDLHAQVDEIMFRYKDFQEVVGKTISIHKSAGKTLTDKIDYWITHRFFGPVLFFLIMIFIFQSIYQWAVYPMDKIEELFVFTGDFISGLLPQSWISDLITQGLLPGLGGVLVFVPQIAILFFLVAILEESGYMSRVVYMFDGLLQKFGMNGRSMVALISSGACAIPAIMSTRTISNPKERLITILVSPLISCSARLPVYAVLIGFVVPNITILGFLNTQGLAFMGLYLLGIFGALFSGIVFKQIIKSDSPSFLMIELPNYKPPLWKNVFIIVKEKVLSFITGAGKIIVIISVFLWFFASFGPGNSMAEAEKEAVSISDSLNLNERSKNNLIASKKLQESYIGKAGKIVEPLIAPLGFDWKIGIALITSFAAREVFVGTMATIYSIGSDSDEKTIREKMAAEVRPGTNQKIYDLDTSLALLVFYVFAMQCMSTLAVTKKETNTWKWPIIQFLFMGVLAYIGAYIVYNLF